MPCRNSTRAGRVRISWASRLILAAACLASYSAAAVPHYQSSPQPPEPVKAGLVDNIQWPAITEKPGLRRRQDDDDDDDDDETATPSKTSSSDSSDTTASTTPSGTSANPSTETEEPSTPSPLPSPLDTGLASSFIGRSGSSCSSFLDDLISSDEFNRCYPVSMLLDGSKSFFDATKSLVSTVRVLDTACEADVESCTEFMLNAAAELRDEANCGRDYDNGQNVVQLTYKGLRAYEMLYAATCLQDDNSTSGSTQYCYATAVTNTTGGASNVYPYLLPLNLTMHAGATPACNWCLEETMSIFQAAAADRDQFIADTYEGAARHINTVCGPEFANDTLPEASENNGVGGSMTRSWGVAVTVVAVVLGLL